MAKYHLFWLHIADYKLFWEKNCKNRVFCQGFQSPVFEKKLMKIDRFLYWFSPYCPQCGRIINCFSLSYLVCLQPNLENLCRLGQVFLVKFLIKLFILFPICFLILSQMLLMSVPQFPYMPHIYSLISSNALSYVPRPMPYISGQNGGDRYINCTLALSKDSRLVL